MNEIQGWVTVGGSLLLFLGTVITVLATRGKTKADYKTAFDERIDKRVEKYMEDLESKYDLAVQKSVELEGRVETLEEAQEEATKREKALYRYTAQLRDHILSNSPPPPPAIPEELAEWYETFDVGKGLA